MKMLNNQQLAFIQQSKPLLYSRTLSRRMNIATTTRMIVPSLPTVHFLTWNRYWNAIKYY